MLRYLSTKLAENPSLLNRPRIVICVPAGVRWKKGRQRGSDRAGAKPI